MYQVYALSMDFQVCGTEKIHLYDLFKIKYNQKSPVQQIHLIDIHLRKVNIVTLYIIFLGSSGCCQGHCGHGASEPGRY